MAFTMSVERSINSVWNCCNWIPDYICRDSRTVGAIRFGIVNTPEFELSRDVTIPTILQMYGPTRIVHIPRIFSKYLVAFQVIIAFVQDQLMLGSND